MERGCSSAWSTILIRHVETKLRLRERWQVENGMLYVPHGELVDWVEYFLEVLDVADLLYQERIRLREIRREIALQMDAQAEQFAFESILLNMDLLLQQVS